MFYAVYYYDPMGFYRYLGVEMSEPAKGVPLYLIGLPCVFIFVSLILLVVAIIICLIDGRKQNNKFGKSTKYVVE